MAILTNKKIDFSDMPDISDIDNMLKILTAMGAKITRQGGDICVDSAGVNNSIVPESLAKELRSSVFLLGPILARFKKANISLPGGCKIGARPIDIHLEGLRQLNCKIEENEDSVFCDASQMRAAEIALRLPSVGATENLMMAASTLSGVTKIHNAAQEPEIECLANLLNKMGAKIMGAGTGLLVIEGVKSLKGTHHRPIGDRIVAGTYIIATAACGGAVRLKNTNPEHNLALIKKINNLGCQINAFDDIIEIVATGAPKAFGELETFYHPAFPTDLQAQMMALACVAEGESLICENVFENRFAHAGEFLKMGANITIEGNLAKIKGVPKLNGATLISHDLRGGAALVIAALSAKGKSIIENVHFIERGYQDMAGDLLKLGADIGTGK